MALGALATVSTKDGKHRGEARDKNREFVGFGVQCEKSTSSGGNEIGDGFQNVVKDFKTTRIRKTRRN